MESVIEFITKHRLEGLALLIVAIVSLFISLENWIWILVLVGIFAFGTMVELRSIWKERIGDCVRDFDSLIKEFEKFFNHPYWAIMPNPFNQEPEWWKYYADTFFEVFKSWFSSLKDRFEGSKSKLNSQTLLEYVIEFYSIVRYYRFYAESFRKKSTMREYSIQRDLKKQYNESFVKHFNDVLLRNMSDFSKRFERIIDREIPDKKIDFVKEMEFSGFSE